MPDDIVDRCLRAARVCAQDPWAIRKTDVTRGQVDRAIDTLVATVQKRGESIPQAYERTVFGTEDGRLLYQLREALPPGDLHDSIMKRGAEEPQGPAEIEFVELMKQYQHAHQCGPDTAFIMVAAKHHVLYEQVRRERRWRGLQ
jgi:hypothetical protein